MCDKKCPFGYEDDSRDCETCDEEYQEEQDGLDNACFECGATNADEALAYALRGVVCESCQAIGWVNL